MGAIIFLLFLGVVIFISIKVSDLKHRATQHILKNTGISSSDIASGINSGFEKKYLEKFLQEHSNYTEDSIKDLLKQYADQIFNRNLIAEFDEKVCEKIQTDTKLDQMQKMEFRRTNISYYKDSKLGGIVVYTDGKDEYNMHINCNIIGESIRVEKYQINKGAVVGF